MPRAPEFIGIRDGCLNQRRAEGLSVKAEIYYYLSRRSRRNILNGKWGASRCKTPLVRVENHIRSIQTPPEIESSKSNHISAVNRNVYSSRVYLLCIHVVRHALFLVNQRRGLSELD